MIELQLITLAVAVGALALIVVAFSMGARVLREIQLQTNEIWRAVDAALADPAKIARLAASLKVHGEALKDAVSANTPRGHLP